MKTGQTDVDIVPSFELEQELIARGFGFVAGIDEVGRGALAGPVVAAAVILSESSDELNSVVVGDSKELTASRRAIAFDMIIKYALDVGIGIVSPQIIDEINILGATRRAMYRAITGLSRKPDFLLVDGMRLPNSLIKQRGIIKGDKLCLSIACASIIAKVTRDRIMTELDNDYPGYGFALHKGYGTRLHMMNLIKNGPLKIHRYSFAPVRNLVKLL